MAVVVMIGVLAVVAVYGVRKYVLSSKVGEAVSMMTNIKTAEEAYKDETYTYMDVSQDFSSHWYPAATPGRFKTQWGDTSSQAGANFRTLGVYAGGPVQFAYAVVAAPPGGGYPQLPTAKTNAAFNMSGTTPVWMYVAVAKADLDGDPSTFTYVVSHSFSSEIYLENDGL
jgi:Tfp pilus assembly protein PilE